MAELMTVRFRKTFQPKYYEKCYNDNYTLSSLDTKVQIDTTVPFGYWDL